MELKDATILIVDDEPILLKIFANWFTQQARVVLCAENGAEALKILETQKVNLIITDIRMPIMDGVTLLAKIHTIADDAPSVIFVSGFADIDPREACELGVGAFIEKPVRREVLVAAARRCLQQGSANSPSAACASRA